MKKIIIVAILAATLAGTSCMPEDPKYFAFMQQQNQDSEDLEYQLIWNDEFDEPRKADGTYPLPGDKWLFETGGTGWGNNEDQYYVDRVLGADTVAKIKDGCLVITAYKLNTPYEGKNYISARMNSYQFWTYGRFEMRAKLPAGVGTWPAFWMLPQGAQSTMDGEIDIMEHVGYEAGDVWFSVHTGAYTPALGTGRNAKKVIPDYNTEFHVYAVEWTENFIAGYIDNECYFTFINDHRQDRSTWPFSTPFNLKLNLAIGGDWGGYMGIDDSIFPASFEIDYVRVYQRRAKN